MHIISLSCIIYTYCKLILKNPSGRINKKVLYCIVSYQGSCEGSGPLRYTICHFAPCTSPTEMSYSHL